MENGRRERRRARHRWRGRAIVGVARIEKQTRDLRGACAAGTSTRAPSAPAQAPTCSVCHFLCVRARAHPHTRTRTHTHSHIRAHPPTHPHKTKTQTGGRDWGLRSGAWALLPPSRVEGGQSELRGGRVSLFCSRARARTHDIAHGAILPLHKHVDRGWPHGMVARQSAC